MKEPKGSLKLTIVLGVLLVKRPITADDSGQETAHDSSGKPSPYLAMDKQYGRNWDLIFGKPSAN